MKLGDVIEGLQVLRPHYAGGDGYHLGADHDVIFAYSTETPLSEAEITKLLELGWSQVEYPGMYQREMTAEDYDPNEGWKVFV